MASQSRTTIDHDEIRRWAETHEGRPVHVRGSAGGDDAGVLRIDFPGGTGDERFEELDWDDWFAKFDRANLALVYQERKADGSDSTFNKLVDRDAGGDEG